MTVFEKKKKHHTANKMTSNLLLFNVTGYFFLHIYQTSAKMKQSAYCVTLLAT